MGCRHRHGLAYQEVEAERLGRGRELVASGQFGHVADQVGQFLELDQHVVHQHGSVRLGELVNPADDLQIGAQAGERSAELVGGIEHELALRPARRLQGLEEPVEGPAQPAQFVGSTRGETTGDVGGLGQVLHGVRQRVEGYQRRPGHQQTQHDGQQDAAQGDPTQHQTEAVQFARRIEQGDDLQRARLPSSHCWPSNVVPTGSGSTSSRNWFPPTSTVVK